MIPVPNMRLAALAPAFNVDHAIVQSCAGGRHESPRSQGAASAGATYSPDDRSRVRRPGAMRVHTERAPVAEFQSVPGLSSLAAERGGHTERSLSPRKPGDAPMRAPANLARVGSAGLGVDARLAEPPSLLHILTWLRYHARRRP